MQQQTAQPGIVSAFFLLLLSAAGATARAGPFERAAGEHAPLRSTAAAPRSLLQQQVGQRVVIAAGVNASAAFAAALIDQNVTEVWDAAASRVRHCALVHRPQPPLNHPISPSPTPPRPHTRPHTRPHAKPQIILPPGTLVMRPALFHGYGINRPKGIFPLDRNITISSADPISSVTSIDWSMMDATLLLQEGRVMTLESVAVSNIRWVAAGLVGLVGAVRCGVVEMGGLAGLVCVRAGCWTGVLLRVAGRVHSRECKGKLDNPSQPTNQPRQVRSRHRG